MKACADANGYRADFCFFSTAIVERRILIEYTFIFFSPIAMVERRILIEQTSVVSPLLQWKGELLSSRLLFFPTTVVWKGAPAAIIFIQCTKQLKARTDHL